MAPRNTATNTDGTTATKEKKPRGPQRRVFHVFYRPVTIDGSPVPDNVKVDIVTIMSDARKVVDFMDSPEAAGLKRYKHEVISNAKGEVESEGAAKDGE